MKGFDKKGVSPVIATILLIALTVAAVGIVAVILSTISRPTVGINAILTLQGVYNPSPGAGNNENKCAVELMSYGPDTITDGSVSVEFEGTIRNPVAYEDIWVRGFVDKIGQTAKSVNWVTDVPISPWAAKVSMWPWSVGAGAKVTITIEVTGAGTDNVQYVEFDSITLKDATAGTVIFQDTSLPAPTAP